MRPYAFPEISELHHQLTQTPSALRLRQILDVERTIAMIEPGERYPVQSISCGITGARPAALPSGRKLPAVRLIPDLVRLAENLSKDSPVPVSVLGRSCFTREQLVHRFNVSTRTIQRWQSRGLVGVRAVLPDDEVATVFSDSSVRGFVSRYPELVHEARSFTQLSQEEKVRIIARAWELLLDPSLTFSGVCRLIAAETGRKIDTIRNTIRRHDKQNPDHALFDPDGSRHVHPDHGEIHAAYRGGQSVEEIGRKLGRSPELIRQVVNHMRARQLRQRSITFIPNDAFEAPDADERILSETCPLPHRPIVMAIDGAAMPFPEIRNLCQLPLLTKAEEQALFRRYNYLKCKAHRLQSRLDPQNAEETLLDEIDTLLSRAAEIRNRLIECNLRLVVSIARKFVRTSDQLPEAVSEGNLTLMRAVEKFDYARGNRFSTYATWAVSRTFVKSIPAEYRRSRRQMTGRDEVLNLAVDQTESVGPLSRREAICEMLTAGWKTLSARERKVLQRHYALSDRDEPQTFEEIGRALGFSRARAQQIQRQAIIKLRTALAPMQAEIAN